jgi:hypothetical protein
MTLAMVSILLHLHALFSVVVVACHEWGRWLGL